MRARSALVAMVCLDLFAGLLLAQQAATAAAAATLPAAVATVKTNTNLVLVDVVVTANGAPVHGLTATQMKVLEAGHEQKITSFEEHVVPWTMLRARRRLSRWCSVLRCRRTPTATNWSMCRRTRRTFCCSTR